MKLMIRIPAEMIKLTEDRVILRGEEGEAQVPISILDNKTIAQLIVSRIDVEGLRANREGLISLSEASRRYGINEPLLSTWSLQGIVRRMGKKRWRGFGIVEVVESDVAIAAEIYKIAMDITKSKIRAGMILRHAIDILRDRN